MATTYNPWYHKGRDVEIFDEMEATTRRVLGADGHVFRRQRGGLADSVLEGAPRRAADVADRLGSVRAMPAPAESLRSGRAVSGPAMTGAV